MSADTQQPRAFTDSDVAALHQEAAGVTSGAHEFERPARGPGNGHATDKSGAATMVETGSAETSAVTAGAIPAAGAERFLVFLRDGEQVWASGLDHATAEAALDHVRFIESRQPAGFADGFRIERLVVADPGSFQPLECRGAPTEDE